MLRVATPRSSASSITVEVSKLESSVAPIMDQSCRFSQTCTLSVRYMIANFEDTFFETVLLILYCFDSEMYYNDNGYTCHYIIRDLEEVI